MSENIAVRKPKDYKTSLWSGGTTTELYIYPEDAVYKEGNFQCRISSATVEVDQSDFTSLPGVKRYLSIFSGSLEMIHGEADKVSLEPYEVDCFDGGIPTVSYGKVVDFNLMLKNGADGKMEAAKLAVGETCTITPDERDNILVIYVPQGKVEIEGKILAVRELFICREWNVEVTVKNAGVCEAGIGICRICAK